MSQALRPARAVPPGRILGRELEARGWTQKDLAVIMGRPHQLVNEIIKGVKQITPETALDLAAALGTSAELWTSLESTYRLFLASQTKHEEPIARKSRLYTKLPLPEVIKRGWIKPSHSIDELERAVCQFLGIVSLQEQPKVAVNFRDGSRPTAELNAKLAWVKRVETLAQKQRLPSFDRPVLRRAIPSILTLMEEEDDIKRLPSLLADLGVHFLIVPHLPKTYIDGAAFVLHKRAVLAISLRYDRIDYFWFTVMHELAHILSGHKGSYLDEDILHRKPSVDGEEKEADQMAQNWLVPPENFKHFLNICGQVSKTKIVDFAHSIRRHPGIVLGRLQHDGKIGYDVGRPMLIKVKHSLEPWIDSAGVV